VQAALAKRLSTADPGRVVRHKERLPYVIVATPGSANFKLRDCVLTRMELLEHWDCYTIHLAYYARKNVNAALQRCLGLSPYRVNVQAWYDACPKPRKRIYFWVCGVVGGGVSKGVAGGGGGGTTAMISSYFGSDTCALCGKKCQSRGWDRTVVCENCRHDGVCSSLIALESLSRAQKRMEESAKTCGNCNGCHESPNTFAVELLKRNESGERQAVVRHSGRNGFGAVVVLQTPLANCVCTDCPVTYERHSVKEAELEALSLCKALDLF